MKPSARSSLRHLPCRITAVAMTAVLLGAMTAPVLAEWHVWALGRTERVLRESPAAAGRSVQIAAARGEWESFQVLVRTDEPVAGVNVEPGDLAGPGGAVLRAADAVLYRQHQLHITVPTYRNDKFQPGWYPDALIPFRHPATGKPLEGARFVAAPFDLPAGETHGFWIDVCVPPKSPPGQYRGVYRVTAAGGRAVEVPVAVTVWDFELPRVLTLQTEFGSPADRMRGYYRRLAKDGKDKEPADWAAVDAQCAELLSRHRINATPAPRSLAPAAQPDGSFSIPKEQVDTFRAFVDRYHVNAFCIPHPSSAVKDPDLEREKLYAWLGAWDRAIKQIDRPVLFYTYLRDEPNDAEAYRYVQKWGRAIREAKTAVKVLVVEQTWTQDPAWGDLYGAVDVWCPLFSLFKPESAAKRQALGEIVWTYTALCQGEKTPWWHTDFPLVHYRVPTWMAWRYRIRGLLYWGGMSYWTGVADPWTDPGTLDRRKEGKGQMYNGEGSLVYPGRAAGYEGIAPSLRLKALRDGIEDYEYLAILERLGLAAEAEKTVVPLTPSFFQWDPDPAAYDAARAKLAERIVAAEQAAKQKPGKP